MTELITKSLKQQWEELKEENPKLRIRNAAQELGVSEAELLITKIGETVTPLIPDMPAILKQVETLGYVMALSRNEEVVHERKGVYKNGSFGSHASLFVGEDIDLRMFLSTWEFAFAVSEVDRHSLQFFGQDGLAIHKIYLTARSDYEAYTKLVKDFKVLDKEYDHTFSPYSAKTTVLKDDEIDVENFQNDWISLNDTHDFYGMLQKYKLQRTQALRLAPEGDYAVKVKNTSLREILNRASLMKIPIMVFVGNRGMIQIHTGPVNKIVDYEQWLNVLDPEFNLHVNEPLIFESWVVRKPTEDGVVTALECFNEKGDLIVTVFGKRKPGIPELEEWREIIQNVQSKMTITS